MEFETLAERLIGDGWEFSVDWGDGQYTIIAWKPDWADPLMALPCGKGATLTEAYDDLRGISATDTAITDSEEPKG